MFHPQIIRELEASIRKLRGSRAHHLDVIENSCPKRSACECRTNADYHATRADELRQRIEGTRRLLDYAQAEDDAETAANSR
jgi:hypothetical protein